MSSLETMVSGNLLSERDFLADFDKIIEFTKV